MLYSSDERDGGHGFSNKQELLALMSAGGSMEGGFNNFPCVSIQSLLKLTAQGYRNAISEDEYTGAVWNDNPKNPLPTLEDSEVDKTRGIARANAPLFYNEGWNDEFAHGSDIMFPIVKVAEKLLNEGESIVRITGGFDKMIKKDIHIEVRDMDNTANSGAATNNSCGNGEIHTSAGRVLRYNIDTLKTTIHDIRTPNQAVYYAISSIGETTEGLGFKIDKTKILELQQLSGNVAYVSSSLYEIATLSAYHMTRLFLKDKDEGYTLMVIREIRNLGTKIDISKIGYDSMIKGSIKRSKAIGKWTYLFIELDIPFLEGKTEVVAAIKHKEAGEE